MKKKLSKEKRGLRAKKVSSSLKRQKKEKSPQKNSLKTARSLSILKDRGPSHKVDRDPVLGARPGLHTRRQQQLYYGFSVCAGLVALVFIIYSSLQFSKKTPEKNQQTVKNQMMEEEQKTFHSAGPLSLEFSEASLMSFPEKIDYWSHYL